MKSTHKISSWCIVENDSVILNGEKLFHSEGEAFPDFIKGAYRHFGMSYPKFFKMDSLSKLAFLSAELLLKDIVKEETENNIAIVFANQSASLDTDVKYQESIADREDYFPSPAVFVYTLPNICIGEISIRYKLNSENAFFVFDEFNADFISNYANSLIDTQKADKVLCGWVEYYQGNYKAFLYLVEADGAWAHQTETINTIYNQ